LALGIFLQELIQIDEHLAYKQKVHHLHCRLVAADKCNNVLKYMDFSFCVEVI